MATDPNLADRLLARAVSSFDLATAGGTVRLELVTADHDEAIGGLRELVTSQATEIERLAAMRAECRRLHTPPGGGVPPAVTEAVRTLCAAFGQPGNPPGHTVYEPCVLGADGRCTRSSHDHTGQPGEDQAAASPAGLLPAEHMALTVAKGIAGRGGDVQPNTATMLCMVIERLAGIRDYTRDGA